MGSYARKLPKKGVREVLRVTSWEGTAPPSAACRIGRWAPPGGREQRTGIGVASAVQMGQNGESACAKGPRQRRVGLTLSIPPISQARRSMPPDAPGSLDGRQNRWTRVSTMC